MSDLIDRLRATAATRAKATAHDDPANYLLVVARLSHEDAALMAEAAEALTEARAEIARLGDALEDIASAQRYPSHGDPVVLRDRARAALATSAQTGDTT